MTINCSCKQTLLAAFSLSNCIYLLHKPGISFHQTLLSPKILHCSKAAWIGLIFIQQAFSFTNASFKCYFRLDFFSCSRRYHYAFLLSSFCAHLYVIPSSLRFFHTVILLDRAVMPCCDFLLSFMTLNILRQTSIQSDYDCDENSSMLKQGVSS